MNGLLAEFVSSNQYDLSGSADITRNPDGIPIECEQYPPAKPDLSPLGNVTVIKEPPKAKDMNSIDALVVAGIEQHQYLLSMVSGAEGFNFDGFKQTAGELFNHVKFAAGETFKYSAEGYNKLSRAILATYGTHKQALYVLKRDLGRNGVNADKPFTGALASSLTSTGKPEDYLDDIVILLKALESLKKHTQDVNAYLESLLVLVKRIGSVKDTAEAVELIDRYNTHKKPLWTLPEHPTDTMSVSEVLPAGKVFKFEHDKNNHVKYSMSGDKPAGESREGGIDQVMLSKAIQETERVNEHLTFFSKQLTTYLSFIKRWGEAVKTSIGHLENNDEIGDTVKRKLEQMMDGPEEYLLFYSGFLPKVVAYTDRFVQDSIGLGGKLIN